MINKDVLLSKYSNYNIGGPASYFVEVESEAELLNSLNEWKRISSSFADDERKVFVLGMGTNILFDDRGYRGLIILNRLQEIKRLSENRVIFGSGLPVSKATEYCASESLSGLEWAGGLPGSVGGAIRGNAGAFGGETKDSVESVKTINLETLVETVWPALKCKFGYRSSLFKEPLNQHEFIVSTVFRFTAGNSADIKSKLADEIAYRISHQPLDYPSAGSTFKNVPCSRAPKALLKECAEVIKIDPFPVIPVAYLLSEAGLKGKRIGGAMVSEKHPNFFVNLGGATSSDISSLVSLATETVENKFGIKIEPEILIAKY